MNTDALYRNQSANATLASGKTHRSSSVTTHRSRPKKQTITSIILQGITVRIRVDCLMEQRALRRDSEEVPFTTRGSADVNLFLEGGCSAEDVRAEIVVSPQVVGVGGGIEHAVLAVEKLYSVLGRGCVASFPVIEGDPHVGGLSVVAAGGGERGGT